MGRHVLNGNPPVEIVLRRSARARRMSLRVSQLDGRVTLTVPRFVSERKALGFAREREAWLRGHLADLATARPVAIGGTVPFEGREMPLVAGPGRGVRLRQGVLEVPPDRTGPRLEAFLKATARDRLAAASDRYAGLLGRSYGKIILRDTRSRWGSCSSKGDLMFSWRLIMAPAEVLDYVAAHEVGHLEEMNHSPAFWAVVARLFPEHRRCRDWLAENGPDLHRIRFRD